MDKIKGWIAKIVGKKVGDKIGISKSKVTAVVAVLMAAIEVLPPAFGHAPIKVPDEVYKFLAAAGIWSLRDSIKPPNV